MKTRQEIVYENLRLSHVVMKGLNKRGLLKLNKMLREQISADLKESKNKSKAKEVRK